MSLRRRADAKTREHDRTLGVSTRAEALWIEVLSGPELQCGSGREHLSGVWRPERGAHQVVGMDVRLIASRRRETQSFEPRLYPFDGQRVLRSVSQASTHVVGSEK